METLVAALERQQRRLSACAGMAEIRLDLTCLHVLRIPVMIFGCYVVADDVVIKHFSALTSEAGALIADVDEGFVVEEAAHIFGEDAAAAFVHLRGEGGCVRR